jgi:hypothetical protein
VSDTGESSDMIENVSKMQFFAVGGVGVANDAAGGKAKNPIVTLRTREKKR